MSVFAQEKIIADANRDSRRSPSDASCRRGQPALKPIGCRNRAATARDDLSQAGML